MCLVSDMVLDGMVVVGGNFYIWFFIAVWVFLLNGSYILRGNGLRLRERDRERIR